MRKILLNLQDRNRRRRTAAGQVSSVFETICRIFPVDSCAAYQVGFLDRAVHGPTLVVSGKVVTALSPVALDFPAVGLRAGLPKLIVTPVFIPIDSRPHYDVTRDGERFPLWQSVGSRAAEVTVMVNWTEKLKK